MPLSVAQDIADPNLISENEGYAEVAAGLLAAVERDDKGRWTLPWHSITGGRPINAFSGRRFRGQNVLSLWAAARRYGFATHQWASASAWKSRGGEIRPEMPGTIILVPIFEHDDTKAVKHWTKKTPGIKKKVGELGGDPEGGELRPVIGYKKALWYNASQIEGVAVGEPQKPSPSRAAEALLRCLHSWRANKGPKVVLGGSSAHWTASVDRITLPKKEAFADREGISGLEYFAAVYAHENIHASGSKNRLNRRTLELYHKRAAMRAQEELVAEIGAAFLASHFGLQTVMRPDHSRYVRSWLEKLKDQSQRAYFFWAVREAEKAVDYILARATRQVIGL